MMGEPEPGWWRIARWSLRAHGACLGLSMLMVVLLVGAIPSPDRADPHSMLAYHEATLPWAPLGQALLAVGFLALTPAGLALRALHGRRRVFWDLLALLLVLAAVLEATALILQVAARVSLWELGRDAPSETIEQLVLIDDVAGIAGLLFAFVTFPMVAAALAMIARWMLTRRDLPRSLGWLGGVIALAYVVGQVGIATGQVGATTLARALAMGLLTPIWTFWFAHHLHPGRWASDAR